MATFTTLLSKVNFNLDNTIYFGEGEFYIDQGFQLPSSDVTITYSGKNNKTILIKRGFTENSIHPTIDNPIIQIANNKSYGVCIIKNCIIKRINNAKSNEDLIAGSNYTRALIQAYQNTTLYFKNCFFEILDSDLLPGVFALYYAISADVNAYFNNCFFSGIMTTGWNSWSKGKTVISNCAFTDYTEDVLITKVNEPLISTFDKNYKCSDNSYGVYSGEYAWKYFYVFNYYMNPRMVHQSKNINLFYKLLKNDGFSVEDTFLIKFIKNNETVLEKEISFSNKYNKEIFPISKVPDSINFIFTIDGNIDNTNTEKFDFIIEDIYRLKSNRTFLDVELGYKNKNLLQKNNIKRIV